MNAMKKNIRQFTEVTFIFGSLLLASGMTKALAQVEMGSGTRGGGEVVMINGELRFRDLVDNTTYECVPARENYIGNNEQFQALMQSFSEASPYAASLFTREAARINVCFVDAPLKYINTSDQCALYQTPRLRTQVIGIREVGSDTLLVNRRLLNRLPNDEIDKGAFFVHEVSRSFIAYPSEGNCRNNTDVRNFTRLIVRNHERRVSPSRFDEEMALYHVRLPGNIFEDSRSVASDIATMRSNTSSLMDRLKAAYRLLGVRESLESSDRHALDALTSEWVTRAALVAAILDNDQELAEIYAFIRGDVAVEIRGISALAYLIKERNFEMLTLLKRDADDLHLISELISVQDAEGIMLALKEGYLVIPSDMAMAEYAPLVDSIAAALKNELNLSGLEDAVVHLIRNSALEINENLYFYLVRKNYYHAISNFAQHFGQMSEYVNRANATGETIITQSIIAANESLFASLLEVEGVNPYHQRVGGDTYLHIAVSFNRVAMVNELIARYPRLKNIRNAAGRTALDLARRQRNRNIMRILE